MGTGVDDVRGELYTEQGQQKFVQLKAIAKEMLAASGAFRLKEFLNRAFTVTNDSLFIQAAVDRLVDDEDLERVKKDFSPLEQVYCAPRRV